MHRGGECDFRLPLLKRENCPQHQRAHFPVLDQRSNSSNRDLKHKHEHSDASTPALKEGRRGRSKNCRMEDPCGEDSPLKYPLNPFACVRRPAPKREHKLDELIKLPAIRKDSTSSLSPRSKFLKSLTNAYSNQPAYPDKLVCLKADSTDSSPVIRKSRHQMRKELFNGVKARKKWNRSFVECGQLEELTLNYNKEDMEALESNIRNYASQQKQRNSLSECSDFRSAREAAE